MISKRHQNIVTCGPICSTIWVIDDLYYKNSDDTCDVFCLG